jgi:hypothetical protein
MKKINYVWLERVTPFAWAGALLFLAIAECLAILAEKSGLSSISLARRWSLPGALLGPMFVGISLTRIVGKYSQNPDNKELLSLASGSISILVLTAYVILAGTLTLLQ